MAEESVSSSSLVRIDGATRRETNWVDPLGVITFALVLFAIKSLLQMVLPGQQILTYCLAPVLAIFWRVVLHKTGSLPYRAWIGANDPGAITQALVNGLAGFFLFLILCLTFGKDEGLTLSLAVGAFAGVVFVVVSLIAAGKR